MLVSVPVASACAPFGRRTAAVVLVVVMLVGLLAGALRATPARADTLSYIPWSSLAPGLLDTFDPNSANDCVAGRSNCIDATLEAMQDRYTPMAQSCSHNGVFALAYWRTTATYKWSRNQLGFYSNVPFMNHYDAVFAKYYFQARDAWSSGNLAVVPQAWQIAFQAGDNRSVSGAGDLLLGMNAHVNRDLPFVLAAMGLVNPDGTSRKPDHDKVNQFLYDEVNALLDEEAARWDPGVNQPALPGGLTGDSFFNLLEGWREQAWRNAEALLASPDQASYNLVAAQIEGSAAAEARSLVASNAFVPPLTTTASRDAYCASHAGAVGPLAYPWGVPTVAP